MSDPEDFKMLAILKNTEVGTKRLTTWGGWDEIPKLLPKCNDPKICNDMAIQKIGIRST